MDSLSNNCNNQQQQLYNMAEDQPTMRSMAVMSSACHNEPSLRLPSSSSMNNSKLPVLSLPTPLLRKKTPAASTTTTVAPTQSSSSTSNYWNNIKSVSQLNTLPEIYPLSRTSMSFHVKCDDDLTDILSQIETLLVSSRVTLNNGKEQEPDDDEATIYCVYNDGLKFSLRLFVKEEDEQVILEIRRLSGCSVDFKDIAKPILKLIKNREKQSSLSNKLMVSSSSPTKSFKVPNSVIMQYNQQGYRKPC